MDTGGLRQSLLPFESIGFEGNATTLSVDENVDVSNRSELGRQDLSSLRVVEACDAQVAASKRATLKGF